MEKVKQTEIVSEIFSLTLLINDRTDYCSMVRFSGHVNKLYIEICESKKVFQNVIFRVDASMDFLEDQHIDEKYLRLFDLKDILKAILDKGKIPYEKLYSLSDSISCSF